MDFTTVKGLENLGNSCFMNSVLQCLSHIKPLVTAVVENTKIESSNKEDRTAKFQKFLREHFKTYFSSSSSSIAPEDLFYYLRKVNSRLVPGRQQDAHEYLVGALSLLEDYFKLEKRQKIFTRVFGGRLVSSISCKVCKHASNSYENMYCLSVVNNLKCQEIGSQTPSLEEALRQYFRTETLSSDNKYFCDRCKRKVEASKQYRISDRILQC